MNDNQPNTLLNSLLTTVLKDSFTLTTVLRRLHFLKNNLTNQSFQTNQTFSLPISPEDEIWLKSIPAEFFKSFNPKDISPIFEEAERAIKKITPLIIVLPFELPEKEARLIGENLRATYGPNFLMDTKLDNSLIAGPAFIWKGVYKDYSVKAKIESRKGEILQILKQYVSS